jgi:hypothetical protein
MPALTASGGSDGLNSKTLICSGFTNGLSVAAKCGLPELAVLCYVWRTMSTVQEIETAIQALPAAEREKLVEDLPAILPELNGDAAWERILSDARPRPALTALGDEIAAQFKADPNRFSEIQDGDFDQRS